MLSLKYRAALKCRVIRQIGPTEAHGFTTSPKSSSMRPLIIVIFTLSAVFWLLFSVSQFPWIVPADHNSSLVAFVEQSSQAGAWLLFLSLIAIWLPTGLYGRRRLLVVVGIALLVGWVAVVPWLYPRLSVVEFPIRLGVHILGFVSLVVGAIATRRTAGQAPCA